MSFIPPSEARLERLLRRGYLPAELPPPFTSAQFAAHSVGFAAKWEEKEIAKFLSKPEHFSAPRYGHARRALSIVNPVNQLHVASIISKNWVKIRERLKRSKISEFDPRISLKGSGRSVTGVNFDGVARRRSEILAKYGRYVKTDVARFYPSIYTHAIPWSVVGKAEAKANLNDPIFKASFANRLDAAIRAGQQGQTIGIPIGPDTSRIISELIAVEIEQIASSHIANFDDRAVRYVDDLLIGISEEETPSAVLKGLSAALYEFELEINAEKTTTQGLGWPHSPEWIHYIRNFETHVHETRQRDDLDSYFGQAIYLADANARDNVMLFAARRAASFQIHKSNIAHLVRWLLYSSRRSPSCLAFIAEHLAALSKDTELPNAEIESYILQQLPLKAEAAHTEEVCWLLFWAIQISLKVPEAAIEMVAKLRSSVAGLLTLDLRARGLLEGSLDFPEWEAYATTNGLKSEMWLLSYEATKKGWWSAKGSPTYVADHPFFGDLWVKNVEFYNPKIMARKKAKPAFQKPSLISSFGGSSGGYPN